MSTKLTIVYYSTYGSNHQMATIAAEAAREVGAEVRLRKAPETAPSDVVAGQEAWQAQVNKTADIPEAKVEDMEWADGYLFSAPTRFGVMASQMRAFIDTLGGFWANGGFINKPVSAMSSANNPHAGQEATILSFYTTAFHWGAIPVAPGFTDDSIFQAGGNPYGYSHTSGEAFTDGAKHAISHQTRRLIELAGKLA